MGTDKDVSSRPWEEREKSAIEKLRALLQENPKDHHVYYELGRILLRRWGSKEYEWGIKHLEEAVRLKKGFPEAIELLAVEAAATDQNKAVRLYKKAASIYAAQGNRKKVDVLLNEAATLVVYEGWDLLNGGDYPAAKKKALRALKIYSPCVDARNILGCIHIYRFEFDEAERVFEKAMKYAIAEQDGKVKIKGVTYWGSLDTRPYLRARHGLGLCYMHRGNFQDALTEFDTLLNLNPNDNQGIRFLLADVYHYMGDEKSAEKYYRKYGEPEGAYNYALLLYSTGQKSRAIRLLRNSIKAAPLVAIMLRAYLKMFNFWQEKGVVGLGKNPPLFLHRNAVIGAWNENIDRAKNYADYLQLKSAHDFCSLYGALWLRQTDSYTLLLEAMNATAGNNRR